MAVGKRLPAFVKSCRNACRGLRTSLPLAGARAVVSASDIALLCVCEAEPQGLGGRIVVISEQRTPVWQSWRAMVSISSSGGSFFGQCEIGGELCVTTGGGELSLCKIEVEGNLQMWGIPGRMRCLHDVQTSVHTHLSWLVGLWVRLVRSDSNIVPGRSISAPGMHRASFFDHSPPVPVFGVCGKSFPPPHQRICGTFSPCLRIWPILCTQFMTMARVVVGSARPTQHNALGTHNNCTFITGPVGPNYSDTSVVPLPPVGGGGGGKW